MKQLFSAMLLVLMLTSYSQTEKKYSEFSASNDTIVLRTQKQKGGGLFLNGAGLFSQVADTVFSYTVKMPKNISNIYRAQIITDLTSKQRNYINIAIGTKDGKDVFIVDQNNNRDFTDDGIYIIKPMNWQSAENSVKCRYLISNGKKMVQDSTWIDLGTQNGDLFYRKNEHLTANFKIDSKSYTIGISEPFNPFTNYGDRTQFALINDNGKTKDTLLPSDILKAGEFVKLNNHHYRLVNMSHNGEYLTLIRENDFSKKTGLQVGMLAPAFKGVTVDGTPINSDNLHDKSIIVINSCGCGGDIASTDAYYQIEKKYRGRVHMLRLDSKIEKTEKGLQMDVEEKENKDVCNTYRGEYCSRTCYIIDKNNRVIDKFDSSRWQEYFWSSNISF